MISPSLFRSSFPLPLLFVVLFRSPGFGDLSRSRFATLYPLLPLRTRNVRGKLCTHSIDPSNFATCTATTRERCCYVRGPPAPLPLATRPADSLLAFLPFPTTGSLHPVPRSRSSRTTFAPRRPTCTIHRRGRRLPLHPTPHHHCHSSTLIRTFTVSLLFPARFRPAGVTVLRVSLGTTSGMQRLLVLFFFGNFWIPELFLVSCFFFLGGRINFTTIRSRSQFEFRSVVLYRLQFHAILFPVLGERWVIDCCGLKSTFESLCS